MSHDDAAFWRSSGEWSVTPSKTPLARSASANPFPRNLLGNGPAQALLGGGPMLAPDAPARPRRPSRRRGSSGGEAPRRPKHSGKRAASKAEPSPPRGRGDQPAPAGRREPPAPVVRQPQDRVPPQPLAWVAPQPPARVAPQPPGRVVAGTPAPAALPSPAYAGESVPKAAGSPATTAGAPRHRRARRPRPPRLALGQPTGPHVRLGVLWAAVTFVALWKGPGWAALWLTPVAAMASATAMRTWGTSSMAPALAHNRRARVQPPAAVAAVFSALIAASAVDGGQLFAVVAASATLILVGATVFGPAGRPGLLQRVLIVVGPGLAAGSLVLARSQGLATGLVLASVVALYDSSAYLIGSGAPNRWEGSVAGAASIAALTLTVAAVLSPPFTGTSPWLFGIGAAVLAPIGVGMCRRTVGDKDAPVPALRRLDSLVVLGPAWVVAVAVVLHR